MSKISLSLFPSSPASSYTLNIVCTCTYVACAIIILTILFIALVGLYIICSIFWLDPFDLFAYYGCPCVFPLFPLDRRFWFNFSILFLLQLAFSVIKKTHAALVCGKIGKNVCNNAIIWCADCGLQRKYNRFIIVIMHVRWSFMSALQTELFYCFRLFHIIWRAV